MPGESKQNLFEMPLLKFIWILRKISAKKQDLSISNAEARQLAVMKEVLYDQQQVMGEYKFSYKYCLASLYYFKLLYAVPGTFTFQNIYSLHVLLQLHDVLSKSDKMMAVVKDLFGDDPRVKNIWKLNRILILQNQSYLYFIIV